MKRKFFTNLILLLALNLLVKPFWIFGIDRSVQNMVGDDYGIYFSLFNFSIILNVILDLGITNYNNRNIARNNHLLKKHFQNIMGIKFILAIFYTVVCLLAGMIIGYNSFQFHLLYFLILNQFLSQLILYFRSNISALHFFTTDSILSVLDRLIMIMLCSVVLFSNIFEGQFKIEWFVYVQTISYLISAIIVFLIVIRKTGKIRINFNLNFSWVFLKKTYPYALLVLLMSFYNRIDSVLLERLLPDPIGKQQASIYAHGFRLLDAVSMFGVLFAGMLLPIYSRMLKRKEPIREMITFSFSLLIFIAFTLASASFFYQIEIMKWLKYEHIEDSAPVFAILMCGFIPIATSYIFGTLLTANGSIKELNIMASIGMLLNVGLNILFIPHYQALGAATISLLTQLFTAAIQVFISFRLFKLKVNYILLFKLLAFGVLTILLGYLSLLVPNALYGFILMIVASTIAALSVKVIRLNSLIDLLFNRS